MTMLFAGRTKKHQKTKEKEKLEQISFEERRREASKPLFLTRYE
jgi:hypothetical protein